jgi:hypothetical protein
MTDVYLEQGRTWTFACAVDWPGWARRGKGDEAALEQLLAYADRYAAVVPGFVPGVLRVVGTVRGTGTTDFGAPDARGPWDDGPADLERLADRLEDCWAAFDRVLAGASAELRKGPRGGGRDRDDIARHVQESERSYGRSLRVAGPAPHAVAGAARRPRRRRARRRPGQQLAGALRRAALRLARPRPRVGDRGQGPRRRRPPPSDVGE